MAATLEIIDVLGRLEKQLDDLVLAAARIVGLSYIDEQSAWWSAAFSQDDFGRGLPSNVPAYVARLDAEQWNLVDSGGPEGWREWLDEGPQCLVALLLYERDCGPTMSVRDAVDRAMVDKRASESILSVRLEGNRDAQAWHVFVMDAELPMDPNHRWLVYDARTGAAVPQLMIL